MLLFCLDWAESAALEVLHSSLAKVTCLGLVGWVDVPSLEAEACKVPTDLLGEGRCQSLFFFSSPEAPAVDKLLDCATRLIFFALLVVTSMGPLTALACVVFLFRGERCRFPSLL